MKCPFCSHENTRVIDSRPADENNSMCSCGTYSAFAPLGLFNIPLMKNFSVKKEYLPEFDLFPIQHFAYNRQHYKNLTKEFFSKINFFLLKHCKNTCFLKIMGYL